MNLQNLNLTELKTINGGELPYTEHSLNGASIANQLHNAYDFIRGVWDGL